MRPDPRIGTTLGGYRIDSVIGRGGMGVVYLAEQLGLARRVALKVVAPEHDEDAGFRRRFVREAHLAASIDHPSVIPVYDAGEIDGVLYIAMRYVDGEDLHASLRAGPLEVDRMLAIMSQAAGALDAAHAEGLVHRDVKPANILLERSRTSDSNERVFLTDFGLTKKSGSSSTTQTGVFIGSVDYAAPEQLRGEPIDGRTDVYALGCVMFECLTGAPPFRRRTQAEAITAHLMEPPPRLTATRPDLPPDIDRVLASSLEKSKEARPSSCTGFVEQVHAILSPATGFGPVTPTAPDPLRLPQHARPDRHRRSRLLWAMVGLAAAVGAALGLLLLGSALRSSPRGAPPSPSAGLTTPSPNSNGSSPGTAPATQGTTSSIGSTTGSSVTPTTPAVSAAASPTGGVVTLDPFGVGSTQFGEDATTALAYLIDMFGQPDSDSGWQPVQIPFGPPGSHVRTVMFGELKVWFSDATGLRRFAMWEESGSVPGVIQLPRGIGLGSTVQELVDAYPDVRFGQGEGGVHDFYLFGHKVYGFLTAIGNKPDAPNEKVDYLTAGDGTITNSCC